ncbi:MAG: hypothetical protein HZB39_09145 [Planctomycetes bacterium]|nr:hypothetical protein [Planctomycetota bacterium]
MKPLAVLGMCAVAAIAWPARAAAQTDRGAAKLEARSLELERHAAELRDLVERHARGEDVLRTHWLERGDPRTSDARDAARDLQHSETDARALRDELARLRALREERRRDADRRAAGDTKPREEETDRAPRPEPDARVRSNASKAAQTVASTGAVASDAVTSNDMRVVGSVDHRRVAHALLRAGIELRRDAARLSAEGRVAAAAAQENAARARLADARGELRTLVDGGGSTREDHFALARCEEALGDVERAEALYTEVMARDLKPMPDGSSRHGVFGRAAATARSVLAWSRDCGEWRPRRNVDDVPLPGR